MCCTRGNLPLAHLTSAPDKTLLEIVLDYSAILHEGIGSYHGIQDRDGLCESIFRDDVLLVELLIQHGSDPLSVRTFADSHNGEYCSIVHQVKSIFLFRNFILFTYNHCCFFIMLLLLLLLLLLLFICLLSVVVVALWNCWF